MTVADNVDVRETRLSIDEVVANVARPGAGGIAVFVGAVRDESEGRRITRLDYSAYVGMARREMRMIVDEIEGEIEGARASAIHRVGQLDVGDFAIVCAASAPHRAEAFRACRDLIDRIKARVPVWKREWGPGGAEWIGWVDARCSAAHHEDSGAHAAHALGEAKE